MIDSSCRDRRCRTVWTTRRCRRTRNDRRIDRKEWIPCRITNTISMCQGVMLWWCYEMRRRAIKSTIPLRL